MEDDSEIGSIHHVPQHFRATEKVDNWFHQLTSSSSLGAMEDWCGKEHFSHSEREAGAEIVFKVASQLFFKHKWQLSVF